MAATTDFCRKCILDNQPYVPGKPIEEVKRELGLEDVIKLASNENPLGPSPLAVEAMKRAAENAQLYPDGSCFELRKAMAAHLGVDGDMLIFGAGGDEILFYLGMAFLDRDDELIQANPSFSEYKAAATIMGCATRMIPTRNWTHDLDAMLAAVNEHTKVFVVTNPNNPTGTIVGADEVERVMDRLPPTSILLLDEAYYEYADDPAYTRSIEWVKSGRNVLVIRTFSKIYGLAGCRIGYGIAPASIIACLERVRAPFNVNSIAQAGAVASLLDHDQVRRSRDLNRLGKEYFYREFDRMRLSCVPTQANFVWVDTGADSKTVFKELLLRGVIVRTGDIFGAPTHIRVTTGTPEHNERFVKALGEVLGR